MMPMMNACQGSTNPDAGVMVPSRATALDFYIGRHVPKDVQRQILEALAFRRLPDVCKRLARQYLGYASSAWKASFNGRCAPWRGAG
jgi:hypothetical protein